MTRYPHPRADLRLIDYLAESVVPAQFFPDRHWSGEQKLLKAMLVEALDSLRGVGLPTEGPKSRRHSQARYQADAEAWILNNEDEEWGSFLYICEHLGLDVGQVRKAVLGR